MIIKILGLKGFTEKCLKNNLIECCYQISMNYKNEEISIQYLKSILLLMGLMKKMELQNFFVTTTYHNVLKN